MGRTTGVPYDQAPEALKQFLIAPNNRERFRDFFEVTYRLTVAGLVYKRNRGYKLPSSSDGPSGDINQAAYDILGALLRRDGERPYHIIFDYYERIGINDFTDCEAAVLYDRFRALVLGFVGQELFRLRGQEDPGVAKIKARISHVLKSPTYTHRTIDDKQELIGLSGAPDNDSSGRDLMPYEELLRLIEECYLESTTMELLVRQVLERTANDERFATWVRHHEFTRAIVTVICRHVEIEAPAISCLPTATQLVLQQEIEKECEAAIVVVRQDCAGRFVMKGRISEVEADRLVEAAGRYLADLANGGATDPIPRYFGETMPAEAVERYLADYKYVFETIIGRAVEEFRGRVRNNPTIRRLGFYL